MNRLTFYILCTLSALAFLLLQVEISLQLPIIADEFDGARDVYRLKSELPYRDFKPYKTVLGYYIQLPAILLADGTWQGLMNVRLQMAVINAALLFVAGCRMARLFRRTPALLSLLLWITMSTWLERSAELRVDTLTAWPGLFSLFFLLDKRIITAGILAGISFLVSQKGIYYLIAADVALIFPSLLRRETRSLLRDLLRFNIAAGAFIALYLMSWMLIAGPNAVIDATFRSHSHIVFDAHYDIRAPFWKQTTRRNPLFYLLSILGVMLIFRHACRTPNRRPSLDAHYIVLACYGGTLWALGLLHQQPWPYFFVILIPTFAVLNVAALSLILTSTFVPLLRSLFVLVLGASLTVSFQRLHQLTKINNEYQKQNILLAETLLEPGDTYLAGFDAFLNHTHAAPKLNRLSKSKRDYLRAAPLSEIKELIAVLEQNPAKLLLDNYRLHELPDELKEYFTRDYVRLWGSVYLYAPQIEPGIPHTVRRAGEYLLELPENSQAEANGKRIPEGGPIRLAEGDEIRADSTLRLQSVTPSEIAEYLASRDGESKSFFGDFYSY